MKLATLIFITILLLPAVAFAGDGDYEKALVYLRAGKAGEAMKLLEPLADKDPENTYVQYHVGLAAHRLDRLDDAFVHFSRVGETAGDKAQSEFSLGAAFMNLGVKYLRAKDGSKAEACFKKALELDPADADSRFYLGRALAERGEFDAALSELDKAAELKSGDPKAAAAVRNAIGVIHFQREDYRPARAEFNRTLDIEAENLEALYYLGRINYKEEGFAAAKPYFDRITSKGAPADDKARSLFFTTFFNIGIDFQNRDKAGLAEEMFRKAISVKENDADAHFYRGYNLEALERYEEAVDEFRRALEIDPAMDKAKAQLEVAGKFAAEAVLTSARAAVEKRSYIGAIKLYEKALSLDPAGAAAGELSQTKALLAEETNAKAAAVKDALAAEDFRSAESALAELASLNPDAPETLAAKKECARRKAAAVDALAYKASDAAERGGLGEAAGLFERILAISPEDRKAADGLRQARARISGESVKAREALADGRLLEARMSYEKLIKYVPDDPDASDGLKTTDERIEAEIRKGLDRGREALDGGDLQLASAMVEKVLDLDPKNGQAASLKKDIGRHVHELAARSVREGNSLLERGRPGDAEERFKAALALDPGNASARDGLDRARAAAEPQDPQVPAADEAEIRKLYLAGVEFYTSGKFTDAIEKWREVIKLDPGNEKAKSSIERAEDKMKEAGKKAGVRD